MGVTSLVSSAGAMGSFVDGQPDPRALADLSTALGSPRCPSAGRTGTGLFLAPLSPGLGFSLATQVLRGREQKGNTSGSVWPWGLPLACLGWQPLHGGSSDSLVPLTPSPGTKTETRSRRPCGLGLGPRVARTELTCSWSAAVRSVCTGGAWRCPGPGASADSRLLPSLGPLLPASAWTAPP